MQIDRNKINFDLDTAVSAVLKNDVYILNNYDNKYDKYHGYRDNIFKIHHFS